MNGSVTYGFDNSTGAVMLITYDFILCPVIDFEGIGSDGDFSKPYDWYVEKMDRNLSHIDRVSKNKVPKRVKEFYRFLLQNNILKIKVTANKAHLITAPELVDQPLYTPTGWNRR